MSTEFQSWFIILRDYSPVWDGIFINLKSVSQLCKPLRLPSDGTVCNDSLPSPLPGGLRGAARGGLAGLTLTSLYALYNNWEYMKGSVLQQSL